ncbi:MAG TPA: hypothetical protein VIV61_02885 [Candidatus Ozemobacteraceae bacterium]
MNMSTGASHKRTAFWLFCAFFCFYFLGLGGHIYTPDGTIMFHVTRSLVVNGRTDIPEIASWRGFGGAERIDPETGRRLFYAKYGVGLSLAAVPAFILGNALLPFTSDREKEVFSNDHLRKFSEFARGKGPNAPIVRIWYESEGSDFAEAFLAFAVTWTMPFLVAGILAALFLITTELGFSVRASLGLAAAAGVASPLWHYSKEFFSEPLSGCCLAWFLYFCIYSSKRVEKQLGWIVCGCFLGGLLVAKVVNVVILVPCLLLVGVQLSRHSVRAMAWGGLLVSAGVAAGAGVVCAYNFLRFGTIWSTGYGDEVVQWNTPFWEGLLGLLFSPGRGAVIYCPLLLLALVGFPAFYRRFPHEAMFLGGTFALHVLLYAEWHVWEGGWCWGPRFLIPALPISLIPAVMLFERIPTGRLSRLAFLAVLAISLVVALSGILVSYNDYYKWLDMHFRTELAGTTQADGRSNLDLMRWSWRYSPILVYWRFPVKDYFVLPRAVAHPGLILFLLGAALLGLIGSCRRLWHEVSATASAGGLQTV